MKPSSMDEPTERYRAGSASAIAEPTMAIDAQVALVTRLKILEI